MSNAQFLIDTNIFVRIFSLDSKKAYLESQALLELIKTNQVDAYTHDLVLSELVWVLQSVYKASKEDVIRASLSLMNISGLKIKHGFNRKLAFSMYKDNNVKFVDACLASIDQVAEGEWTVVSYDQDFAKLPVKWMTPREVVSLFGGKNAN